MMQILVGKDKYYFVSRKFFCGFLQRGNTVRVIRVIRVIGSGPAFRVSSPRVGFAASEPSPRYGGGFRLGTSRANFGGSSRTGSASRIFLKNRIHMDEKKKTAPAQAGATKTAEKAANKAALREAGIRMQLLHIQQSLAVPKDQANPEKDFRYRSVEDILAAVKPLLEACGCTLTFSEELTPTPQGVYIRSTAALTNLRDESIATIAFAREDTRLPDMSSAQITGSCISYARKYAAGGLFAIDNTRLAHPIEMDSFAPSAVEELKRAEDGDAAPVMAMGEMQSNSTDRPILRAGQRNGWEDEVERVIGWKGTEEEFKQYLLRRWIVSDADMVLLLARRKEPFAG